MLYNYSTNIFLKLKSLKDQIKEYKCEYCTLTEWNNNPIPLKLNHINGDHFDNSLENLRL